MDVYGAWLAAKTKEANALNEITEEKFIRVVNLGLEMQQMKMILVNVVTKGLQKAAQSASCDEYAEFFNGCCVWQLW